MIKYISVNTDGYMWAWDCAEDAESHLFEYGLSAGEQVAIHEVEVEPTNLDAANIFILYKDCGAEFVSSPDERDKRYDDMVDAVYVIKNYLHSWAYRMELTVFPIDERSLPF